MSRMPNRTVRNATKSTEPGWDLFACIPRAASSCIVWTMIGSSTRPGAWYKRPATLGRTAHDILVGNFGSGLIAVFDPITGEFKDVLRDAKSAPIAIYGLRALSFGNGTAGLATILYFTAGTNHGSDGLLGTLIALQNPQGNDQ
jgi:hypothetical protein